jgi:hypothetical protein
VKELRPFVSKRASDGRLSAHRTKTQEFPVKLVRPAACAVVALSLVGAGAASAATKPKPVCNLVTDAQGDANGFVVTDTGLPVPPSDDYLDIVSADIASDAKTVTAALRLKAVGADSMAPTGSTYYFNFTISGTQVFLTAKTDGTAWTYSFGDFTGDAGGRNTLGDATGVIDAAKKEIRITASTKAWPDAIKTGKTKLAGFNALAQRFIGTDLTGGATPTADEASSSKAYLAGASSCVRPGK